MARLLTAAGRHELRLLHFDSPAFQAKLVSALALTSAALAEARRPYVAVSGGKDSTAVMGLALRVRPEIALMWSDDELEMPETVAWFTMLRELAGDQLTIITGWARHAGWFDPWRERPFWRDPLPGMIPWAGDNDDYMRAQGHDLVLTGLRGGRRDAESHKRQAWLVSVYGGTGAATYATASGSRRACPIWDWTADDVWALIAGWRLPANAAYDRMEEAGIDARRQRVGPLPLVPRATLEACWPELLPRLEARYGPRWR